MSYDDIVTFLICCRLTNFRHIGTVSGEKKNPGGTGLEISSAFSSNFTFLTNTIYVSCRVIRFVINECCLSGVKISI